MTETNKDVEALEAHFKAARARPLAPPDALLARVLADAEAVQATPAPVRTVPRRGWRPVLRAIGGWPAAAGLLAATLAGVWIGASPPEGISAYLPGADVAYIIDLAPGTGLDLVEGAL